MENQEQLINIKDRIFGKGNEPDILDTWDYLMTSYGWIPFDEFKKLDAHVVAELVSRLSKRIEKENAQNSKK